MTTPIDNASRTHARRSGAKPRLTRFDLTRPDQIDALLTAVAVDGAGPPEYADALRALVSPEAGSTPIAAQLRRSGDRRGQEASLRRQLGDAVRDLPRRNEGLRLVIVYVIEAVSGGLLWREKHLAPVVADAQAGLMRELWTADNSRLGRMPHRQKEAYKDALEAAGVLTLDLSKSDPRRRDSGTVHVDAAEDGQSHDFVIDRARYAVSGLQRAFHDREDPRVGTVAYGFFLRVTNTHTSSTRLVRRGEPYERAHYEVAVRVEGDPVEVATVRLIFVWFLGDDPTVGRLGPAAIAHKLNALGIRSPGIDHPNRPVSGLWSPKSVRDLLKNDAYVGNSTLGREVCGTYMTAGPDGRPVPVTPATGKVGQVRTREATHAALISPETWARSQAALEARSSRRTGKGLNANALRSGRVVPECRCSCGAALYWLRREGVLRCSSYHDQGPACGHGNWSASEAEIVRLLWRAHAEDVGRLLGATDLGETLRDRVRAILAERTKTATTTFDEAEAKKRVQLLSREVEKLGQALASAVISGLAPESVKAIDAEIRKRTAERTALEARIASEKKTAPTAPDLDAQVEAVMGKLAVLAEPAERLAPEIVRRRLAEIVDPGTLALAFSPSPQGGRRKFRLARVTVGMLEPGAAFGEPSMPVTVGGRSPPCIRRERRGPRRGSGPWRACRSRPRSSGNRPRTTRPTGSHPS
jgi:hypothetical protein